MTNQNRLDVAEEPHSEIQSLTTIRVAATFRSAIFDGIALHALPALSLSKGAKPKGATPKGEASGTEGAGGGVTVVKGLRILSRVLD